MPWTYTQRSGMLFHDGKYIGHGYSGINEGKDNPDMQNVHDEGPTPRGKYTISAPFHHPRAGNYTMRLIPALGTFTYGRDGLMIHGDSIQHPGQASSGCIILRHDLRVQIWDSGDHNIEVVP